jgi:ArsR family transcriptional regulator
MNHQLIAQYCKAMAHPIRVRIMEILIREGQCITGSLCDQLPVAQSTVSQHLKILKENGLICGQVDGPKRCYCVHPVNFKQMKQIICEI